MSGIFDKYITMLSGTSKSMNSKANAQRYISTIDGHEIVIPAHKMRRSSSVSSDASDISAGMMSRNGSVSGDSHEAVIMEVKEVKVKTTPNNRVNF
ncbi:unnamed protein product [Cyberlindnera jadinii]|uniref:Uncharacterized protein n=1 Tax=Cyberlindnera jadinii (strain ATCC 18201 / CBS 1600 / BCRC 20928 / JCM 3617 / NBRC 0987 / NRRL Y-1542) TaxID=983966 RepID=A0A0H5C2S0_CYBJN|nr:unnamed protein product [Cyberlindnera jadinii]